MNQPLAETIFWIAAAACIVAEIAILRSTFAAEPAARSGLGCGDHWPDCYGAFTPAHDSPTLLVEISHRYGAAALSIAIIALVAAAWVKRKEPGVGGRGGALRPAVLALVLVVVAAVFG